MKLSKEVKIKLGRALVIAGLTVRQAAKLVKLPKSTLHDNLDLGGITVFEGLKLDLADEHTAKVAKGAYFLDIETSTVKGHSFGVGKHARFTYTGLSANQETKILSVVYASMYDLLTKGIDGLQSVECKIMPEGVCDKNIIQTLHDVMTTDMEVLIAHNVNFDKKWLLGRMMLQGLSLPRVSPVDTLNLFRHGNMLCKKLDYLSSIFFGTRKIDTKMADWIDIMEGKNDSRQKALDFMVEYNHMDVFLMLPLYLIGARYNADRCVDFTNYDTLKPQCRVTGEELSENGLSTNHTTGLKYSKFRNERLGVDYINRRSAGSKKALEYRLKQHV